jgi:glycine/D-amino acid oxidase-like deaminating enzyme
VRVVVFGAGLAGMVLAGRLIEAGVTPHVVGDTLNGIPIAGASGVAAGVFNPITGKRMQLTWQAATLWPELERFYAAWELRLKARFFYPMHNVRPLYTPLEREQAIAFASQEELNPWVSIAGDASAYTQGGQLNAPAGVLVAPRAGYVEVPAYLAAMRSHLVSAGLFSERAYSLGDVELILLEDSITYEGQAYDYAVFARGVGDVANPLLPELRLAPLKGEILELAYDLRNGQLDEQHDKQPPQPLPLAVLNRAGYLAPRPHGNGGLGSMWAGSTYEHRFASPAPTEEGGADIQRRIEIFAPGPYRILRHLAGVRPSSPTRRPFIGVGGVHSRVWALNGLGTKGVSIAPWAAGELVAALLERG